MSFGYLATADFDIEEVGNATRVRALRPGAYHWGLKQPWLRESLAESQGCWLVYETAYAVVARLDRAGKSYGR